MRQARSSTRAGKLLARVKLKKLRKPDRDGEIYGVEARLIPIDGCFQRELLYVAPQRFILRHLELQKP